MKTGGAISIAKIVGTHGLRGTCKIFCYGEWEDVFEAGRRILLKSAAGVQQGHEIDWVKPHARTLLLALKGISDRSQAETLVGCEIMIDKSSLPRPAAGTYYWHELIGLAVVTLEGRPLGRLTAVMPTGSNDVYVVSREEGGAAGEILIPALKSVVVEVDLTAGRMRVDLPEGLE
ncbi:MAG: ribosome maturation factor RimM [Desulfobacterales bacterium]